MLVIFGGTPTWRLHTGFCKLVQIISPNIWSFGKRTDLKLGEVSYIFVPYTTIISWLYTLNGFRIIFQSHDSATQEHQIKLIGLAVRLYQQFWKEMNCQIFLNIILSFAYLMCPSVSRRQALKNMSVICYVQFQWKLTGHFPNRIKNYGVFIQKSLSLKKYFERKNRRHVLLFMC